MINKQQIQHRFKKASTSYDQHAVIQTQVAHNLVEVLLQLSEYCVFSTVLEIGCGTGIATRTLLNSIQPKKLYLNDFDPSTVMIDEVSIEFFNGDIEYLTLPFDLDLVFSSSVFQWLNQPQALLKKIKASLHSQGILAFSVFGPSNMQEIKQLTGLGLEYLALSDWQALLEDDFEVLCLTEEKLTLAFDTPLDILRHIQGTGVNAVNKNYWGKTQYQTFCQAYRQQFLAEDQQSLKLSYHPIYCVAKKN